MERFRIQNLRCLKDTNYIDLKPLTVLVGKNSSGKSTLLRFFPLMKQTLETRTNEPILWYSPGYVDFGSFEESLNFISEDKHITFEFDFSLSSQFLYNELFYALNRRNYLNYIDEENELYDTNLEKVNVNLKIVLSKKLINKFELLIWDQKLEVIFSENNSDNIKILINGDVINNTEFIGRFMGSYSSMLPRVFVLSEGGKINPLEKQFKDLLFDEFSSYAHTTTKDSTIEEVISSIKPGHSKDLLQSLQQIKTTSKKLQKKLQSLSMEDSDFLRIQNFYLGLIINDLIEICNVRLMTFFSSVKYIAPLRASAERYYRIQGLSLDEIDPQGANIPMLLTNMSIPDKKSFNTWIKDNFKFEIIANTNGGHTSLYIKYNNDFKINLADTGFGYSQILPIILVLWQASQKSKHIERYKNFKFFRRYELENERDFTIVIEQPELHLHPSLQAMLIDTFAKLLKVSNEIGIDLKIIIETHSETMINRIGHIIAEGYEGFNKDLVNILIFNTSNSYDSDIKSTGYTDDGYLSSWPIGFFSPEEL